MATDDLAGRDWLLLPGTLCTADVFAPMLDSLGVAPERRHGIEMRHPTVDAFLPDIADRAEGAVVCGFSLGAIVAAHLSDRIKPAALVLFGVNPLADDPAKAPVRRALAEDVKLLGGSVALERSLPCFAGASPEAARARVLAMADATAPLIDVQTVLALSRPGALPALSRATMPVYVLTGSEDGAAPPSLGKVAAEAAPMGQFVLLDGLGHFAMLEDDAACAAALMHAATRDS